MQWTPCNLERGARRGSGDTGTPYRPAPTVIPRRWRLLAQPSALRAARNRVNVLPQRRHPCHELIDVVRLNDQPRPQLRPPASRIAHRSVATEQRTPSASRPSLSSGTPRCHSSGPSIRQIDHPEALSSRNAPTRTRPTNTRYAVRCSGLNGTGSVPVSVDSDELIPRRHSRGQLSLRIFV